VTEHYPVLVDMPADARGNVRRVYVADVTGADGYAAAWAVARRDIEIPPGGRLIVQPANGGTVYVPPAPVFLGDTFARRHG
jgi:hypothetical protein